MFIIKFEIIVHPLPRYGKWENIRSRQGLYAVCYDLDIDEETWYKVTAGNHLVKCGPWRENIVRQGFFSDISITLYLEAVFKLIYKQSLVKFKQYMY